MNAKFVCKGDVVFSIDQEHMQSIEQGFVVCEDGICTESDMSDVTPVYGSYSMKYNKSKSAKAEKYGAKAKTLGLPSYVVE